MAVEGLAKSRPRHAFRTLVLRSPGLGPAPGPGQPAQVRTSARAGPRGWHMPSDGEIRVTCVGCLRVFMCEQDFWQHVRKGPGASLRSKCRQVAGKRKTHVQAAAPHQGQSHVGLQVRNAAPDPQEGSPEPMATASGMTRTVTCKCAGLKGECGVGLSQSLCPSARPAPPAGRAPSVAHAQPTAQMNAI